MGSQLFFETRCLPLLLLAHQLREVLLVLERPGIEALPILVNVDVVDDEDARPRLMRIAVFDASARQDYERELLGARHAAERSEAQVRVLQQATVSLGAGRTIAGVAAALSATVALRLRRHLGDGHARRRRRCATRRRRTLCRCRCPKRSPSSAPRPEAEAFRRSETITMSSISDIERRYPAHGPQHARGARSKP